VLCAVPRHGASLTLPLVLKNAPLLLPLSNGHFLLLLETTPSLVRSLLPTQLQKFPLPRLCLGNKVAKFKSAHSPKLVTKDTVLMLTKTLHLQSNLLVASLATAEIKSLSQVLLLLRMAPFRLLLWIIKLSILQLASIPLSLFLNSPKNTLGTSLSML